MCTVIVYTTIMVVGVLYSTHKQDRYLLYIHQADRRWVPKKKNSVQYAYDGRPTTESLQLLARYTYYCISC